MAVKPGYKQTEGGEIPVDWESRPLAELGSWKGGATPSMRNSAFWSNGTVPWVSSGDIKSVLITDTAMKITELAVRESSTTLLPSNSIMIVTRSGILRKYLPVAKNTRPVAINQDIKGLIPNSSVLPDYLLHVLIGNGGRILGTCLKSGTTVESLEFPWLKVFHVALPRTKTEQGAIAEALNDADALIKSLEQLVAKKRQIKQGSLHELFLGRKRLPGFGGKWEMKALGEIGESLIGLTYRPSDVKSDGLLVLRSSNVFEGSLRFDDNVFVAMDVPERIIVQKGDILICVRNGSRDLIGKCAKIDERAQGITFGAFMAVFRTPFHNFVYHQFQSHVIKRQINEHLGATINQITNKSLNSFRIPFPKDEKERTAIAEIISDIDEEIVDLERKLTKYRQLKQGMMHNLLTGRIRLVATALAEAKPPAALGEKRTATAMGGSHTWALNEAVLISVLADQFGKPEFPLGRKRRTKLSYLFHRKTDQEVQGYLKKAAGPYNPRAKYAGPEKIAQENGYVRNHQSGRFIGFIAGEKIAQAQTYFAKWYDPNIIEWLQQFRFKSNDELERLATVDMAMQELLKQNKNADVDSVRALIASEPEWLPKLNRSAFSDVGIAAAIAECHALFG